MKPPKVCLLWKNGRSALGWGSLLWALGKIEVSAGRTALGWSFLWVVGAWHSEEVVWLILGFHSCVLLLGVFPYRWESVTVKVLSLIRKQSIGHCLFWLISNYKAVHFDRFFQIFSGQSACSIFFGARRSAPGARRSSFLLLGSLQLGRWQSLLHTLSLIIIMKTL